MWWVWMILVIMAIIGVVAGYYWFTQPSNKQHQEPYHKNNKTHEQPSVHLKKHEQPSVNLKKAFDPFDASLVNSKQPIYVSFVSRKPGAPLLKSNQHVRVNYKGFLPSNKETPFDANQGFEFVTGKRQVIPGWDVGLVENKVAVGDELYLVLAPEAAYGDRGAGQVIPPNATLVFYMEIQAATDVTDTSPQ